MKQKRVERLNSEFKREISSILAEEIKDPRLTAIVSIVNVNITNDLSYADIHVSMLGDEKSKKEVDEIIKEMTPKEKKKATSKSGKKK